MGNEFILYREQCLTPLGLFVSSSRVTLNQVAKYCNVNHSLIYLSLCCDTWLKMLFNCKDKLYINNSWWQFQYCIRLFHSRERSWTTTQPQAMTEYFSIVGLFRLMVLVVLWWWVLSSTKTKDIISLLYSVTHEEKVLCFLEPFRSLQLFP